jgi:hypothetical protein
VTHGVAGTAHDARIADLQARLRDTTTRFLARLGSAGARAEQAETGWTPAQVASHVAMVNENLASVIDGTVPAASPPAADFQERDWDDIARGVPARNEAPARFQPPSNVTIADATTQFEQSVSHLARAIGTLTADRAVSCITNRVVGTISLYQAGDFAIAHMIRHNQQLKRILGA